MTEFENYRAAVKNSRSCESMIGLENSITALNYLLTGSTYAIHILYVYPVTPRFDLLSQATDLLILLLSSLNPVLTLRFAISLKQATDPEGEQEWRLTHFSSLHFAGSPTPEAERSGVWENAEMVPVNCSRDRRKCENGNVGC